MVKMPLTRGQVDAVRRNQRDAHFLFHLPGDPVLPAHPGILTIRSRCQDAPGRLLDRDLVDHGLFDLVVAQLGVAQEGSLQSTNSSPGRGQLGAVASHRCLGEWLGRQEVRVGVERLFARFPEIALDPACEVEIHGFEFRGPREVWVTV